MNSSHYTKPEGFSTIYYVPDADVENTEKLETLMKAINELDPFLKGRVSSISVVWEQVGGLVVPQIDMEFEDNPSQDSAAPL